MPIPSPRGALKGSDCRFYALVWGAVLVSSSLLPTFRHFREFPQSLSFCVAASLATRLLCFQSYNRAGPPLLLAAGSVGFEHNS